MHSIERYGIVALLFLVVTVVAVLMWDGGKGKKKKEVVAAGHAPAAVHDAPPARADESARERRLSLLAEGQPGPLVRQPLLQNDPPASTVPAETPPHGLSSGTSTAPLSVDPGAGSQAAPPADVEPLNGEPPKREPLRSEPGKEPVVGAAPASGTHTYSVQAGDTLSHIAQRELGSAQRWREIVAANPGLDPAKLRVGKTIQIPGGSAGTRTAALAASARPASAPVKSDKPAGGKTWKVGQGENLWRIAERALGNGKRWREIAALNPSVNPDRLVLGQVLVLPGGAASASQPAPRPKSATKAEAERPTLVASNSSVERGARRGGRVK